MGVKAGIPVALIHLVQITSLALFYKHSYRKLITPFKFKLSQLDFRNPFIKRLNLQVSYKILFYSIPDPVIQPFSK